MDKFGINAKGNRKVKVLGLILIFIQAASFESSENNSKKLKQQLTSTIRPWPPHEFLVDAISNSTRAHQNKSNSKSFREISQQDESILRHETNKDRSERYRTIKISEYAENNRQWTFPIISSSPYTVKNSTEVNRSIHGTSLIPLTVIPVNNFANELSHRIGARGEINNRTRIFTSSKPMSFEINGSQSTPALNKQSTNSQSLIVRTPFQLIFNTSANKEIFEINNTRNPIAGQSIRILNPFTKSENVPISDLKDTIQSEKTKLTHLPTTIFYRPVINHYVTANSNSSKYFPPLTNLQTPKPSPVVKHDIKTDLFSNNTDSPEIKFKIWSYFDGNLDLISEKKVPAWVVGQSNYSDGEIVNLETMPQSIKTMVHSAMNYTGTVAKRHSGPGNDFHWQRLPIVVSESSSWDSSPAPVLPTLNYVLWSANGKPSYPNHNSATLIANHHNHAIGGNIYVTTPTPLHFKDGTLESWLKIQCDLLNRMKIKGPSLQSQYAELATREKEILSSIIKLANSKQLELEHSEPTNKPGITYTKDENLNDPTTQHDEFWASLYPVYQNLIKTGTQTQVYSSTTPMPNYYRKKPTHTGPTSSEFAPFEDYNLYTSSEADYSSDPLPPWESLHKKPMKSFQKKPIKHFQKQPIKNFQKKPKKNFKKKIKKGKKIFKKFKKKKGKYGWLDPSNFEFNYDFGIDILSVVKKMFYTIIALKTAPLIILTFLAITPMLLIFWPKVLKYIDLGHSFYNAKYSKPSNHGQVGWNPPSTHRDEEWDVHHHYHGYPVNNIGALVQSSYGDPIRTRELKHIKEEPELGDYYYDPELDTQHNRKVMEILINSKNATLSKLLENWSLERYIANQTAIV